MSRSACLAVVSEQHFNVPDFSVAVFFYYHAALADTVSSP